MTKLCLALDVPTLGVAKGLVSVTREYVDVYKVGLELFAAEGPTVVTTLISNGYEVFLDLKLHDIPATMVRATKVIRKLGVSYTTLHAAAGGDAMRACADEAGDLRLLAVTVLTSEEKHRGTRTRIQSRVREAIGHRVSGFICAPSDCAAVKAVAKGAFLVTPGIRPAGVDTDDQKRVSTPLEAVQAGSDMLVVGRAIRNAADPREAARAIREEMNG